MGFFTPSFGRRRFIATSLIGLVWFVLTSLLWALPKGGYRRGVAFYEYGLLDAFVRITDYRTNPGETLGYKAGDGFALSIVITILATAAAIGSYVWLVKHWRKPGYCPRCDYDLRGTTSCTCPECGEVIPDSIVRHE